jgi:RNA polymerase sigma-70 factor (ECF subfamily)
MQRHEERLFRYLLRLTGDGPMAEDVFQQTWVQVAERISRYDARRPFAPWRFTVARNLALDQLRRLRPASLEETGEPSAPGGAGDDPFARAVAAERGSWLVDAIAALGPLDREGSSSSSSSPVPSACRCPRRRRGSTVPWPVSANA